MNDRVSSWIDGIATEHSGKQTTIDVQRSYARLTGTVISVDKSRTRQGASFVVYTSQMKKKFTCNSTFFCPVQERDAISVPVEVIGTSLTLLSRPILNMPRDPDSIVTCFVKGAYGTSLSPKSAWELHRIFLQLAGSEDNITDVIDTTMLKWKKGFGIEQWWLAYANEHQLIKISNWWYKNRIVRPLYMLGLTNKDIQGAHLEPRELLEVLHSNPYKAVSVSLDKCNEIVAQLGLELSDEDVYCGTVLRKIYDLMCNNGWNASTSSILMKNFPDLPRYMDRLRDEYGLVGEHRCLYLDFAHKAEQGIAKWVTRMANRPFFDVPEIQIKSGTLSEEQISAICVAISKPLSIITGGPGTGKTTVITEIIKHQTSNGRKLDVVSFTGKAVSRIREVTKFAHAATMHQVLTVANPEKEIDHLIIDESSMVPLELLHKFIERFKPKQVTLIGDKDQLEPIGWGAVFEQLLKCREQVPIVRLTKVYRTGSRGITSNLEAIREPRDEDDPPVNLEDGENFTMFSGDSGSVSLIMEMMKNAGITSDRITVITAYNKDVGNINLICQQVFDEGQDSIVDQNGIKWRVGDRVMATENRYDIGIMNGEEGRVVKILPTAIQVQFGAKAHDFSLQIPVFSDTENEPPTVKLLIHSYAITVHRSQGSEWDIVIFYLPTSPANLSFVTKRLIYTALSRAKQQVFCIGDLNAMNYGANKPSPYRCDNLVLRIQELAKQQ